MGPSKYADQMMCHDSLTMRRATDPVQPL